MLQQHCEAQLRGARTVREGQRARWLRATVPKGASKGRFRRTGEARRVATAAEKLTGTLQVQVLPPRRPPQSLHARAQLQSSARASQLFPRHFPRVGLHKMAVLRRQNTSRKTKGTPRSVESIRTGRACPSSSGLERISEKEAGRERAG